MGLSFHFLGTAAKDVGKAVHGDNKPGGGVFGFLDKQLLPQSEQAKQNRNPIAPAEKFVTNNARGLAQSFAKVPETAARSGASLLYNKGVAPALNLPQQNLNANVNDPIRKGLYGTNKLQTYQTRGQGVHEAHPSIPGPLVAAGLAGLDLTPFGKGKTLSEKLIKASDVGAVKKLVPGIDDAKAAAIAGQKDPHVIENLLSGKNQIPAPPPPIPPVGEPAKPTPIQENITKEVDKIKGDHNNYRVDGQLRVDATKMIDGITAKGKKIDEAQTPSPAPAPQPHPTPSGGVKTPEGQGALSGEHIPPPASNPFDDILGAVSGKPAAKGQTPVKGILSARAEQNALLRTEHGQRFGKVAKSGETQFGDAGYFQRRAALKGAYSKVDYHPMIDDLGEKRTNELFTDTQKKIYSTPDSVYEKDWKQYGLNGPLHATAAKFNTEVAVRKVLGLEPGLPTDSEIRLLGVHSPQLAAEAQAARPVHHQLMNFAAKLFGTVRAAKSTLDFSMGGRQGIFVAGRHPVIWARANKESVKYAKSSKYFHDSMRQTAEDPWVKAANGRDLGLTGIDGHEEQYAASDLLTGKTAKKVGVGHLVAGSERAYMGGLTDIRADLWKSRLQSYGKTPEEASANLGEKGMDGLAESVRTLTGRGGKKGGFVEKHGNTLNEALFSPRLWASRLEPFNPAYWKRLGPAGRKEAFQNLAAFAGVASVVLGAAAVEGGVIESDPRSSDFLKIKFGDTRYDILGGFQQNLVFGWRQLSGERKSSQTGKTTKFARSFSDIVSRKNNDEAGVSTSPLKGNRVTGAADLVGNKLNPVLSSGLKIYAGEDKSGQPVNVKTEIGQLFVPISVQGTFQTIQHEHSIAKGIAKNSPDYLGFSSQTYGIKDLPLAKGQQKYVDGLKSKGAPKDQVDASKLFFQVAKTGPDRANASNQIKKELQKSFDSGDFSKAEKLAQDYNKKYASAFKDWTKQYGKYGNDENLVKEYNKGKITSASFDRWLSDIDKERKGEL